MPILRDAYHAFEILQADGAYGLIRSFPRWVSRKFQGGTWRAYSDEAKTNSRNYDFTPDLIEATKRLHLENQGRIDIKSVTWFIPDFQHPFYGGIYTILRFADYFCQTHGVKNQFAVIGAMPEEEIRAKIVRAFPALQDSNIQRLIRYDQLDLLEPSDASIATLWNTAYFALNFQKTRRKFYFLQDLESLFYPAGSIYAQIDSSYRFGFYCLANTPSLKKIYSEVYGGEGEYFVPCVDTQQLYPDTTRVSKEPYKVFFYGRPEHPRNGFELGATTLSKLKLQFGDRIEILSAGARWQPADYGLKGVVNNLGLLSLEESHELYRQCDAGLVMMFTRHPSYLPFELMASGCLVVTNYNPATTWFLRDGENCLLSEASQSCLAERIAHGLLNSAARQSIVRTALAEIRAEYSNWSGQIEKIYRYIQTLEHS